MFSKGGEPSVIDCLSGRKINKLERMGDQINAEGRGKTKSEPGDHREWNRLGGWGQVWAEEASKDRGHEPNFNS